MLLVLTGSSLDIWPLEGGREWGAQVTPETPNTSLAGMRGLALRPPPFPSIHTVLAPLSSLVVFLLDPYHSYLNPISYLHFQYLVY